MLKSRSLHNRKNRCLDSTGILAEKQKREGKLFSTSLPSLYRKCNADLDYESVTDSPDWIVKVPFLLVRCRIFRGVNISPEMIHRQSYYNNFLSFCHLNALALSSAFNKGMNMSFSSTDCVYKSRTFHSNQAF